MAKPLHPTVNSIKQGQTIYMLINDSYLRGRDMPWYMKAFYLHGKNTFLPDTGFKILKLPANYIKDKVKFDPTFGNVLFYSKRKAVSRMKLLNSNI